MFIICFMVSISIILIGCSNSELNIDVEKLLKAKKGDSVGINESFEYKKLDRINTISGVNEYYKKLTGVINELNVYTFNETKSTLNYEINKECGEYKLLIICNGKVQDEVTNSQGSFECTSNINQIILVANKFTGTVVIGMVSDKKQEDHIEDCYVSSGKFTLHKADGWFLRVETLNGSVTKMAKVKLSGKLVDGYGEFKFDDDEWGNSGIIKVQYNNPIDIIFNVEVKKDSGKGWGMKTGNYSSEYEPLPFDIKSLLQ